MVLIPLYRYYLVNNIHLEKLSLIFYLGLDFDLILKTGRFDKTI